MNSVEETKSRPNEIYVTVETIFDGGILTCYRDPVTGIQYRGVLLREKRQSLLDSDLKYYNCCIMVGHQ